MEVEILSTTAKNDNRAAPRYKRPQKRITVQLTDLQTKQINSQTSVMDSFIEKLCFSQALVALCCYKINIRMLVWLCDV